MSKSQSIRGTILKYKADRRPVAFVTIMFAIHVALWLFATPLVCLLAFLPLTILSMFIAPINHHHQHLNAFRDAWANRVYDLMLSLQTGIGPYSWVLHHNFGHHMNYLNQPPHDKVDESHWAREDGSTMGRFEYTVHLYLNHQIDIYRVGKKHPKIYKHYLWMKLPLYALIALGFYINPINYLIVFFVPGVIAGIHTCYATYEHHAGYHSDNHLTASRNRESAAFNFMTCNLGLHTAHHKRPGLHWSLLPKLHAEIRQQIPAEQLIPGFFDEPPEVSAAYSTPPATAALA